MANYMDTFKCAKSAVVTYAPPGWNGHHHVNLQEEDYWIARFEENGFKLDENKTKFLRSLYTHRTNKTERPKVGP